MKLQNHWLISVTAHLWEITSFICCYICFSGLFGIVKQHYSQFFFFFFSHYVHNKANWSVLDYFLNKYCTVLLVFFGWKTSVRYMWLVCMLRFVDCFVCNVMWHYCATMSFELYPSWHVICAFFDIFNLLWQTSRKQPHFIHWLKPTQFLGLIRVQFLYICVVLL